MRPKQMQFACAVALSLIGLSLQQRAFGAAPADASTGKVGASSDIQRASAVIKVEGDSVHFNNSGAQAIQAVMAALTSTTLVDPAMKSALNLDPSEWPKVAQIEVEPAGDIAVKVTISVKPRSDLPPDAANKLLGEISKRAMRSFNEPTADGSDDKAAGAKRLETLVASRTEIDQRLAAIRNEIGSASASGWQGNLDARDPNSPTAQRTRYEQQLVSNTSDAAVAQATIDSIESQLKELDIEHHPELRDLQVKLITERSDARIGLAKCQALIEQCRSQLAELKKAAASTRPARTISEMQAEVNDLIVRRNELDARIAQLNNERNSSGTAGRLHLTLIDGSGK